MSAIKYFVDSTRAKAHYFAIKAIFSDLPKTGVTLSLPAWIPGSYMIRDFAARLSNIRGGSGGRPIEVQPVDKQSWWVNTAAGDLVIEYDIYAWDLSVRSAYLDQTRGFFNGTSLFLRIAELEHRPCTLYLTRPDSAEQACWKVATSLTPRQVDANGWGEYGAENYAELIDSPVEMGEFSELAFDVQGVPHRMVLSGRPDVDTQRLAHDLERICSYQAGLFGELPIQHYLFITQVVADGYGGLEHKSSSVLLCSHQDLPVQKMPEPDKNYLKFMGLCSHEYFHLWNVKRIRPKVLAEADLSTEVHTRLLWAFEGITSYYDDLALLRCGCIESKQYLDLLARTISSVQRCAGRKRQSVAESSFYAWTKFYKQDENATNTIVSYYSKGALVAFGLDMELRQLKGHDYSLDGFMRWLWQRRGKTDIPVDEDEMPRLIEQYCQHSMNEFFSDYVDGTAELPLSEWFSLLGIGFRLRPRRGRDDMGGVVDSPSTEPQRLSLGADYVQRGDFIEITKVFDNGAAMQAGIAAGDRIVALNGWQVHADDLDGFLQRGASAPNMEVHLFRHGKLLQLPLTLKAAPEDTCELWFMPPSQCSAEQLTFRKAWLEG